MGKSFAEWKETAVELGAPFDSMYSTLEDFSAELVRGGLTILRAKEMLTEFKIMSIQAQAYNSARVESAIKSQKIMQLFVQMRQDILDSKLEVHTAIRDATPTPTQSSPPTQSIFPVFGWRAAAPAAQKEDGDDDDYPEQSQLSQDVSTHLNALWTATQPLDDFIQADMLDGMKRNLLVKKFWDDGIQAEMTKLMFAIQACGPFSR